MLVIAENLNTRNASYMNAVLQRKSDELIRSARALADAGAGVINIQCSLNGIGDEEALPFVAEAVQTASECGLSLDTRNVEALKRTVPLCAKTPFINYVSGDEEEETYQIMEIASYFRTNLVLRAHRGIVPHTLEAKMQILYELIESANRADIPNERLFADPSIGHIGHGAHQSHLVNSHHCIIVLKETVEPPIKTLSWISNVSTGISRGVRSEINSVFFSYLAGAGLDAAVVDVFDQQMMSAAYLVRLFRDEVGFSYSALS